MLKDKLKLHRKRRRFFVLRMCAKLVTGVGVVSGPGAAPHVATLDAVPGARGPEQRRRAETGEPEGDAV